MPITTIYRQPTEHNYPRVSRRDFLKAIACVTASVALGVSSQSCSPSLQDFKKANDGIEGVVYDCNPVLPIPKRGCYTGTNNQGLEFTTFFEDTYGLPPAFNAPGAGVYGCHNQHFPLYACGWLHDHGIVPMLRYIVKPHPGFKSIANGCADDYFKSFANKAAEFGKAAVIVPWQCVNEPIWARQVWPWSRADPGAYKSAWVRMHDIFEQEGANKNVVWSTKLVVWGFDQSTRARDPFDYIPDKEHVDILGWLCSAYFPGGAPSFNSMFRSTYIEACTKYRTKPQMFWELGTHNSGGDQAGWFDSALSSIAEQYSSVKGVMFDVHFSRVSGYNPAHSDTTSNVIRNHFSSGYFKGRAIP